MTGQEKQEIREIALDESKHSFTHSLGETVLILLNALDERDGEVERIKESIEGNMEALQGWYDDYEELEKETKRLRKALMEIAEIKGLTSVEVYMQQTARQALAREEKE